MQRWEELVISTFFIFLILECVLNLLHLLLSKTPILPFPSELLPCPDSTPTNSPVHIFPIQFIPSCFLHFSSLHYWNYSSFFLTQPHPLLLLPSLSPNVIYAPRLCDQLGAYVSLLLILPLPLLTFLLKLWFSLLYFIQFSFSNALHTYSWLTEFPSVFIYFFLIGLNKSSSPQYCRLWNLQEYNFHYLFCWTYVNKLTDLFAERVNTHCWLFSSVGYFQPKTNFYIR